MACWEGTLTPTDTWPCPFLHLHMFYLLRSILSPNLPLFFLTMHFERSSVLSRFPLLESFGVQMKNIEYFNPLFMFVVQSREKHKSCTLLYVQTVINIPSRIEWPSPHDCSIDLNTTEVNFFFRNMVNKSMLINYPTCEKSIKASAHSFKQFTSRLLKLSFSLSMHLYTGAIVQYVICSESFGKRTKSRNQ